MKSWRPREDRKTVHIGVRVRMDAGWVDATVRNVSSRGMMLHSIEPLQRNQFVEITRGRTRVVGRVVWSDDKNFGLLAQDAVDVPALLGRPGTNSAQNPGERRSSPRPAAPIRSYVALEGESGARIAGRAMEFAMVVLALASISILTVSSALEAAEQPLEKVRIALATDPR